MRVEQIAIIYPDETLIPEFREWLKPYSSLCRVLTFTSLAQAVPILSKFPCDLLIAADRFPEAQGAILLKGLRRLCPQAQFILLATNDEPLAELTALARHDLDVHYFSHPWDKQSLLAHIEAGIGKETPSFVTAMSIDEQQALRISSTLENLLESTAALSIYLVTELGQVLDYKGSELAQIGEISSLLGGSFAALQQVGATLGEHGQAENLIQRQGQKEDLYALSVGSDALLVLRFAVGPDAPRIGTVAFYARQAVAELSEILNEYRGQPTKPLDTAGLTRSLDTELDQLFTAGADPTSAKRTVERLMSFTQALKNGLVSKGLIDRWDSANPVPHDLQEGEPL